MDELSTRIAGLSPQKRALLELRLKQSSGSAPLKPESEIQSRPDRGSARASFAQQRLWFLHRLAPESNAYNIPNALHASGPLNLDALAQSPRRR